MALISNCTESIIKDAALALKEGHLVAFPTETVYGLGADATNEEAVARVYEVKGRPTDHPLIVHISSMELMDKWASEIPEYAIKLARAFWPGPMTLVLKRTELAKDFITGSQDTVAIRVPSHTLANQLLKEFEFLGGYGVAAPSANRFGKVSPTTSWAVEEELNNFLSVSDLILDGGESEFGLESTIIDCTSNTPIILRPGFITSEILESFLPVSASEHSHKVIKNLAPGMLKSHYSPNAELLIGTTAVPGAGYIALTHLPTPPGAIRLASPRNIYEYAKILYSSFRLADQLGLNQVCVSLPPQIGIGIAIKDRIEKAAYKKFG